MATKVSCASCDQIQAVPDEELKDFVCVSCGYDDYKDCAPRKRIVGQRPELAVEVEVSAESEIKETIVMTETVSDETNEIKEEVKMEFDLINEAIALAKRGQMEVVCRGTRDGYVYSLSVSKEEIYEDNIECEHTQE